jgi:hypothetical protein
LWGRVRQFAGYAGAPAQVKLLLLLENMDMGKKFSIRLLACGRIWEIGVRKMFKVQGIFIIP